MPETSLPLPEDDVEMFPVVVVGAGLAGLSAAVHLADRGIPPLVLEEDRLFAGGRLAGGWQETFDYQGRTWSFMSEHGMHALWGGYENMRAMLDRYLALQFQPSGGEEWINRWGMKVNYLEAGNAVRSRWIPAPFHYLQLLFNPRMWDTINPLDFLSLPGFLVSILLTVGFDPLKERRALDGLLMKEYFRGWTPVLRSTFKGLGVNLLAAPEDEIDLAAFIAAIRFYTMLRRDSWMLHYLPGSAQESLIQPLMDRIRVHGGEVMQGAWVRRLEQIEGGWRIIMDDSQAQGTRSLLARHVILAVDPAGAKRLLCQSPDTATVAEKLIFPQALRSNVVRLWFDKSPREGTAGGMMTGDFVPDNFFWLHRLYDDFREWHEVTGGSCIELHFYSPDSVLDMPDPNMLVLATSEVQRAFPRLRGHLVHGTVRHNARNQTRFRIPTDESLHVVTPWEGIYACGDWIGYDTPTLWMERCVTTAIAASNGVLARYGREAFPVLAPRPPELTVRALGGVVRVMRRLLGPAVTGILRNRPGRQQVSENVNQA